VFEVRYGRAKLYVLVLPHERCSYRDGSSHANALW